MFKKTLKKIFDFYIITKVDWEDVYYARVAKEKYSEELVKEKLKLFDYKKPNSPLKILKVFKHNNWEDYNLLPALKHFGEVIEYPIQDINPYSLYWQFFKKRRFNKKFVENIKNLVSENKINLIFCLASGLMFLPKTFKEINRLGIPVVNFAFDDHLKFTGYPTPTGWSGNRDICKFITLSITTYRESCEKYLHESGRPLFLPVGGNPEVYKPVENIPKDIDVCFVGKNYGKRKKFIDYLINHDINIHIFGLGWPNGAVSIEKLVELYSRSKIALGFSDSWGSGKFGIWARDFEVPLIGPMYLTEKNNKLTDYYEAGKEIVFYEDTEDLLNKIRYYLSHDAERQAIAKCGRERVLRDHTWEKRFEYIFKFLDVI